MYDVVGHIGAVYAAVGHIGAVYAVVGHTWAEYAWVGYIEEENHGLEYGDGDDEYHGLVDKELDSIGSVYIVFENIGLEYIGL